MGKKKQIVDFVCKYIERSVENNSIIEKFRSFKQDNMIFFSQIFLRSIFKFLLKFNKNFMVIFIISPFQTKIPYIC